MDIDDSLKEVEERDYCTTVELIDYKPVYRKHVGKSPEVIATKIMQHCMIYLMSPNCPIISVIDDERYCINDMFEKRIKREDNPIDFVVGTEKFSLVNAKIQDASVGGSKIYLYANDRMVKPVDLDKTLVDLDKNIYDDKGTLKFIDTKDPSYTSDNGFPKKLTRAIDIEPKHIDNKATFTVDLLNKKEALYKQYRENLIRTMPTEDELKDAKIIAINSGLGKYSFGEITETAMEMRAFKIAQEENIVEAFRKRRGE